MHLSLAQIRAFECIVRLGSFHAAAQHLGLTQPSVSQRIRELELTLGSALFIRRGPRISLTAEGHALVDHAERLIGVADEIVERFRSRDPLRGLLRLGLNESFAMICLTELLGRLEKRYPELKTSVHVGDTGAVGKLLNERKLDIAVVSEPELEPHVHGQQIGVNEMQWIAGAKLPVPAGPLTPAQLASYHLIISPPGARLHGTVTSWFQRAGVTPMRVSSCNSLSATVPMILDGLAMGLVPVRLVQEHISQGRARIVPVTPAMPGHRVSLCYQASEFGPSLQAILELMRELITQYRLFS